eukprot:5007990-Pyramimonas_sp.AAC.1
MPTVNPADRSVTSNGRGGPRCDVCPSGQEAHRVAPEGREYHIIVPLVSGVLSASLPLLAQEDP